jgi:serine/threonine protein kinase HipA of HipAB toxin-antitoxin module
VESLLIHFKVYNGKFSVIKYNPSRDYSEELKSVQVSSHLSLVHYLNEIFRFKQFDTRRVQMSDNIGRLQGICPPREFFPSLKRTNHSLLKSIIKSSLPTFSLMAIYHLIYSVLWIRNRSKSAITTIAAQ